MGPAERHTAPVLTRVTGDANDWRQVENVCYANAENQKSRHEGKATPWCDFAQVTCSLSSLACSVRSAMRSIAKHVRVVLLCGGLDEIACRSHVHVFAGSFWVGISG